MKKFIFIITLCSFLFVGCKKAEVNTSSSQLYYNQYVGKGTVNEPFARVLVSVAESKAKLNSIDVLLEGTTNISDIESIKLYSTADSTFNAESATLLGELTAPETDSVKVVIKKSLPVGENTLWVTCDISNQATEGSTISAMPTSITIDNSCYELERTNCSRDVLLAFNIVYNLNQDGSKYYRIPAIVTAPDGSLVALIDKRGDVLTDLPNTISIVARRSTDGGKSWSPAVYVAKGDSITGKKYGDAAVVTDFVANKIIAIFVGDKGLWDSTAEEPQRLYVSESEDCGLTWSEPRDITNDVYDGVYGRKEWQGMFAGSGHVLQLENGRLMFVVAARHTRDKYELHNYAIYSDDHGKTWKASLNSPTPNPKNRGDEAKVVELTNGDVLMSIRNPDKEYRKFAISKNKGVTWQPAHVSDNLIEPACNGDIIRYNYDGKNYLIHSLPGSKTERENVTIYLSDDEGKTWNISRQLVDGMSAYSSLTVLPDGTIGCLVEVGRHHSPTDIGIRVIYYNFSLDWVLNNK
jgi:hypothetical protein